MGPLDAYVFKLQQQKDMPQRPDMGMLNWTPASADASFYRGILGPDPSAQPPGLLDMLSAQQTDQPGMMGRISPPSLLDMITGRPGTVPSNGPDRFAGEAPQPRSRPVKPDSYVIRKGDTLSEIAKRYGTTVKALMAKNPQIKNANRIKAGASLKI